MIRAKEQLCSREENYPWLIIAIRTKEHISHIFTLSFLPWLIIMIQAKVRTCLRATKILLGRLWNFCLGWSLWYKPRSILHIAPSWHFALADYHDTSQSANMFKSRKENTPWRIIMIQIKEHTTYNSILSSLPLADHYDTSQSAIMSKRINFTPWLIMATQTKEDIFSLPS